MSRTAGEARTVPKCLLGEKGILDRAPFVIAGTPHENKVFDHYPSQPNLWWLKLRADRTAFERSRHPTAPDGGDLRICLIFN